jgi:hypothetical protein
MASTIESEINENISLEQIQISSDEQTNTDESPATTTTTPRTAGQTAIGAKLVKKLEKICKSSHQRTSFS